MVGRQLRSEAEQAIVRIVLMTFPFYIHFGTLAIHSHLFFELLAYAVAFRAYQALRKNRGDALDDSRRWWVIAAAAVGALLGGRLLALLENPANLFQHWSDPNAFIAGGKTIVGALIGGLVAVELMKRVIGIAQRTGDLFAIPLCIGIAIGRIGCFLSGLEDHTFGTVTSLPWAVSFGDGIRRHPTQLYEILFAIVLGTILLRRLRRPYVEGDIFKFFMVAYFAFRFLCDFLKPDHRVLLHMTAIQWACVAMLLYYSPDVLRWLSNAVPTAHSTKTPTFS